MIAEISIVVLAKWTMAALIAIAFLVVLVSLAINHDEE